MKKLKQGYIDDAGTGHIVLTQGKEALCNAHNFYCLAKFNWCAAIFGTKWYAVRGIRLPNGKRKTQLMHRFIMGDPEGMEVDHFRREGTLATAKRTCESLRTRRTATTKALE